MALVSPILFLFVFASIEFSRACMMRHTVEIAAAQGARRGIVEGATKKQCKQAALAELALIGVRGGTATVGPERLNDQAEEVTVTVTAPVSENGYVFSRFFLGESVSSTVTLRRETPSFN